MTEELEIEQEEATELRPAPPTESVAGTLGTWLKRLLPLGLALVLLSATVWSISIFGLTIYRDYLMVPSEVKVPEVTNMEIKEAYEAIEAAGLRLQVHENRYDKKVEKRVVLSQNPAGGKMVREGRTILVVVSLGPELMDVPKLTGESLRTAKIALSNAKLRVGEVTFAEAEYGLDEEVVKQNPSAGKAVPRGERIHLQVRRGWR
jgi:eukaryotic-like serine/threonine-protein kinase